MPLVASAHSEEVFLLPIGQFVALLVIWVLAWKVAVVSATWRIIAIVVALAIIGGTWFTSGPHLQMSFEAKAAIYFLLGFVPPVAFFAGALIVIRAAERRRG
jgi:hypothetical protein